MAKVIDISNHQHTMNVEKVVRENEVVCTFILTNDGTFVNRYFQQQAAAAAAGGSLVVPYVYLRPNWERTIDIHMSMVPKGVPSIVDVEEGSGGWAECFGAHKRLWSNGRATPLLYWPRFHWETVGKPNLAPLQATPLNPLGVRGHWKSWYPDSEPRTFDDALRRVPSSVWNDNRGGIPVRIVQFTGTGRLPGYAANLDLNYFPGNRQDLAALLFQEDDDMSWTERITVAAPGDRTYQETAEAGQIVGDTYFRVADLYNLVPAGLTAILNAVTSDNVDEAKILADLNKAVTEGTRQAVAGALTEQFRSALGEELGRRLDEHADTIGNLVGPDFAREVADATLHAVSERLDRPADALSIETKQG